MNPTDHDTQRRATLRRLLAAAMGSAGAGALQAAAPTYPDHPVNFIVPQPAGGTGDFVSRLIAQRLSERLGKPFVVENKAGAGGTLGAMQAAKAPADGYTLVLGSPGFATFASLFPSLSFNPATRLAPVGMMGMVPVTVLVRSDSPIQDVPGLVAYAKAHPGKASYASAGQGSLSHLLAAWFASAAGLQCTHIPYGGTAPALTALVGGQVDVYFDPAAGTELVRSGRLRAIATTGAKRFSALPDLPTLRELGLPVQGSVWLGLMTPTGTPRPIIDRLNGELADVLRQPETRHQLSQRNVEPEPMSPEQFAALFDAETQTWSRLIREAGIKPE